VAVNKTFDAISQLDLITNANIDMFVNRAMEEVKGFGMMQSKDQKAIINGYALEKQKEIDPISIGDPMGEDLNDNEETQKAQANLRGTVGGVQGILDIQSSVSKGITDKDAAINLLVQIYGFDAEAAEKMIGNPKPIQQIASDNVSVSASV